MKRSTLFLRIAYWIGAILDAGMLLPMLVPSIGAAMFGITDFHPGPEYQYAMSVGASLMAGWTVLLLWADRKPVERRGVILLTVVPALAGMIFSGMYAVSSGLSAPGRILPMIAVQVFLAVFFFAAYACSYRDGRK